MTKYATNNQVLIKSFIFPQQNYDRISQSLIGLKKHFDGKQQQILQLSKFQSTKNNNKTWKIVQNLNRLKILKPLPYKRIVKSKRRKKIYRFRSNLIYQKYFIWKNFKNKKLIKKFKIKQKKKLYWFTHYYTRYKKVKLNRQTKRNKHLKSTTNVRRFFRLRLQKYNYQFKKLLNQKFHRRRSKHRFRKSEHNNHQHLLSSWEHHWIKHDFLQTHTIAKQFLRSQLINFKKKDHPLLIKLSMFNQRNKTIPLFVSNAKFKTYMRKYGDNFSGWLNQHETFHKQMQNWIGSLKLFPFNFLVLLKKWKREIIYWIPLKKFKNKHLNVKMTQKLLHNNYVNASSMSYLKPNLRNLYLFRKFCQYTKMVESSHNLIKKKLFRNHYNQLIGQNLDATLTNHYLFWRQILANKRTFKQVYRQQYNVSSVEQIQYILENRYRDFWKKSPLKLFKGPRIQHLKYPWMSQKISKKRTYSSQYFNSYRCLRNTWKRKSTKVYRTFLSITKHRHERVKLKLGTRGGNRALHFKLNLLKVILPFYGKLNQKQFKKFWQRYIYIKSHYLGREESFHNKLNTTLCTLIQQFGWAPNTYWAQSLIKSGWVSVSKLVHHNPIEKHAKSQMFPLSNMNSLIGNSQKLYYGNTTRNPFYQLQLNEIVQIHPHMKDFCKQFFYVG